MSLSAKRLRKATTGGLRYIYTNVYTTAEVNPLKSCSCGGSILFERNQMFFDVISRCGHPQILTCSTCPRLLTASLYCNALITYLLTYLLIYLLTYSHFNSMNYLVWTCVQRQMTNEPDLQIQGFIHQDLTRCVHEVLLRDRTRKVTEVNRHDSQSDQ